MRILHCCLSNFYIDHYSYQENLLPKFNQRHNHIVQIIASTEVYDKKGITSYVEPATYYTETEIPITRVPYKKWLPLFLAKKVRAYKDVPRLIEDFMPDVIVFHGMPAYELINVVKYVKENPNVTLYVDSHEDYNNSARNFLSKFFLHRIFYRSIIKKCLPYVNKVLYITEETKDFITTEYRVPENKLEYYPLGGEVVKREEKEKIKSEIRKQLSIGENTILMFHSGKLDRLKKTADIIRAINKINSDKILLLIAGNIPPDYAELQQEISKCERVKWLGWLNGDEVRQYLCACDLYAQPGSQSVTAQNAMCCGTPVMLYPHKSYEKLCKDNVIWVRDSEDIYSVLQEILDKPEYLKRMSEASFSLAHKLLDYDVLAKKIEQKNE